MIRFSTWGAIILAILLVVGCTGVPDRESEAMEIRDHIAMMPGVSDVDLIYDNGVLEGTRFELSVYMKSATSSQISAAATEINTMRGDDFAGHDQRVVFYVADSVMVSLSASGHDGFGQLADQLRELDSRITAKSIDFFNAADRGTRLVIQDATATATVVDAVLQVFASNPVDQIDVNSPQGPGREESWWIRTPLTLDDKRAMDAQLAAARPATPSLIIIRDSRIERLNIVIPSPETAYADIVRVINAVGAGPGHQVQLGWSWADDPGGYGDLRWSGSVDIGNCTNPNANSVSAADLVPAARQLQERIREEYGPCRK